MIVYTHGRVANSDENYRAVVEGDYTDLPLIVLDEPAERERVGDRHRRRCRITIAGSSSARRRSARRSCSRSIRSQGAGLALTTAHYYTPSGRLIQRPWDGAFDEYLTYALRDQNASRGAPRVRARSTRTAAARSTAAAGSSRITSSAARSRASTPTPFTRTLFVPRRVRRASPRSSPRKATRGRRAKSAATHKVTPGWAADRRDARGVPRLPRLASTSRSTTRRSPRTGRSSRPMIHYEVDNDLFGVEEARRNLVKIDPQAQGALGSTSTKRRSCSTSTPRSKASLLGASREAGTHWGSNRPCPHP